MWLHWTHITACDSHSRRCSVLRFKHCFVVSVFVHLKGRMFYVCLWSIFLSGGGLSCKSAHAEAPVLAKYFSNDELPFCCGCHWWWFVDLVQITACDDRNSEAVLLWCMLHFASLSQCFFQILISSGEYFASYCCCHSVGGGYVTHHSQIDSGYGLSTRPQNVDFFVTLSSHAWIWCIFPWHRRSFPSIVVFIQLSVFGFYLKNPVWRDSMFNPHYGHPFTCQYGSDGPSAFITAMLMGSEMFPFLLKFWNDDEDPAIGRFTWVLLVFFFL